ncbi:hypothetical protein J8273_2996 [Carpediemonas membranifera]|uniref:Uncharacterized protein n=1 Tax=Carpediemonas membranifera TaxID=201153 RepID=A0A8J6B8L1_9EUKA|nr:hypothetical protein J8273_2996 [Carpediemonas membranifera]|eukprot:KAG9395429.1 hypothetical protein J8273_2996 [Carpediemonas membranifera]
MSISNWPNTGNPVFVRRHSHSTLASQLDQLAKAREIQLACRQRLETARVPLSRPRPPIQPPPPKERRRHLRQVTADSVRPPLDDLGHPLDLFCDFSFADSSSFSYPSPLANLSSTDPIIGIARNLARLKNSYITRTSNDGGRSDPRPGPAGSGRTAGLSVANNWELATGEMAASIMKRGDRPQNLPSSGPT